MPSLRIHKMKITFHFPVVVGARHRMHRYVDDTFSKQMKEVQ
jgi:hypothetical protein